MGGKVIAFSPALEGKKGEFPALNSQFSLLDSVTLKYNQNRMAASGTKENPYQLKTPPGTSEFTMYKDDAKDIWVCTVGKTVLHYDGRCTADLHAMLKKHGDWIELGSADEQKPAKEGTVEAWGRSEENPIGGWYGLKKGFGMYVPPLMEALGLAELEHNPRNNRMRAK